MSLKSSRNNLKLRNVCQLFRTKKGFEIFYSLVIIDAYKLLYLLSIEFFFKRNGITKRCRQLKFLCKTLN